LGLGGVTGQFSRKAQPLQSRGVRGDKAAKAMRTVERMTKGQEGDNRDPCVKSKIGKAVKEVPGRAKTRVIPKSCSRGGIKDVIPDEEDGGRPYGEQRIMDQYNVIVEKNNNKKRVESRNEWRGGYGRKRAWNLIKSKHRVFSKTLGQLKVHSTRRRRRSIHFH